MDTVIVAIADGKTIKSPGELVTYALGSCVGICLYDPLLGLAGMVHILLPCQKDAVNRSNSYKFADAGIRSLIGDMESLGAKKERMTAKIAGGASMFKTLEGHMDIGDRNIKAARSALLQEKIPLLSEDTGKDYGRTIYFSAETGRLTVKSVGRPLKII